MRASICVEAIGHDTYCRMKLIAIGNPLLYARWGVVEVDDRGRTVRRVHGRTDYLRANGKGSRGVYVCYVLESGKRYGVRSPESWKSVDEYFCHVSEEGEIVRE